MKWKNAHIVTISKKIVRCPVPNVRGRLLSVERGCLAEGGDACLAKLMALMPIAARPAPQKYLYVLWWKALSARLTRRPGHVPPSAYRPPIS